MKSWPLGELRSRVAICLLAILFCAFIPSLSRAQANATLEITAFPQAMVADGVSVTTISVTVRDRGGNFVPDGTQILFETTQGTLSRASVSTANGLAQVQLTAGRTPGTAHVTVSALSFAATGTLDILLVKSRSDLESENEFVEIISPRRLTYSPEVHIFQSDGPKQSASLKYKGVEIFADDMEFDLHSFELKARGARVKIKDVENSFDQISINLKTLIGVGVTNIKVRRVEYTAEPPFFNIRVDEGMRTSLVDIHGTVITPHTGAVDPKQFDFADIIDKTTLIYAKRALAFPAREVQFQNAVVDVAGTIVMRVPLFRVSANSVRPVITEEFVQVGSNQLIVNFPYYLNLRSGSDSILRFRYGSLFARGGGGAGGMFVDLERNWRNGTSDGGSLALRGIARKDWGLSARQSVSLGTGGKGYFQADFPGHRTLVGSAFMDQRLKGGRISYSVFGSRTVQGNKFSSIDETLALTTNPKSMGSLPISYSFGISRGSRTTESTSGNFSQTFVGEDLNLSLHPISMKRSQLNMYGRVSHLTGHGVRTGLTTNLNATVVASPTPTTSLVFGYDYSDDPFNIQIIGRHRVNLSLTLGADRLYWSFFGLKSLDKDRYSIQSDLWYRIAPLWRLGTTTTIDSYLGSQYRSSSWTVAYQMGYRQVGLTYSDRKHRIGIEILGVPIN